MFMKVTHRMVWYCLCLPGPACAHLSERPEVLDVEQVAPPVAAALGRVGGGAERALAGVVGQRLQQKDQTQVGGQQP